MIDNNAEKGDDWLDEAIDLINKENKNLGKNIKFLSDIKCEKKCMFSHALFSFIQLINLLFKKHL